MMDEMTPLLKAVSMLEKHLILAKSRPTKYIRRWKGKNGSWQYEYFGERKGEGRKHHDANISIQVAKEEKPKLQLLDRIDTRQWEEYGDSFKPIGGSGEANQCDFCGKEHEVHYRLTDGKKIYTVGSSCAKKMGVPDKEVNKLDREFKRKKEIENYEKYYNIYKELESKIFGSITIDPEIFKSDTGSLYYIKDRKTGTSGVVVSNPEDPKSVDASRKLLISKIELKLFQESFKKSTGKDAHKYRLSPKTRFNIKDE